MNLKEENKILKQKIEELETRFTNLEAAYQLDLDTLKEEFETKIKTLQAELDTYKHRKNSSNSHIPPSQDQNRVKPNQSLREPSNKKVGGQLGHEGITLICSDKIDSIVKHSPVSCDNCKCSLDNSTEQLVGKRQLFDIPPIVLQVIAHRIYKNQCSCGHTNVSAFPKHVANPVQYGPNVETLIAYLHARQYIPYQRTKEFLNDVMGMSISTGGINNILQRFALKATTVYDEIKQKIEAAKVVGVDETGVNINGKNNWAWTWQNDKLTYILCAVSRGFKTVQEVFEKGLPNAILVHNKWPLHFKTNAKAHQICTAHVLRYLKYINGYYKNKCTWAKEFKALLLEAINLKKTLKRVDYYYQNKTRDERFERLNLWLNKPIEEEYTKAKTLQKKLLAKKDCILYFLLNSGVPSDNNGSERAIRNIKVKQKI